MPDPSPLSGNCDVVKIWKDIVSETPTPKVEPITTPVVPSEPIMQPVNDVVVEIPKVPVVNTEPEVEEKFDDSFIVREVPDTEPGAIGEIADVQINSQGMSEVETSPTLVIEDYDDDVDDFEDE